MNEEEKKAIEVLKEKMTELKQEISGTEDWVNTGYEEEELEFYNTLLNLIDKQQKEIEKLKKKKQDVMNYIEYYLVGNYRLERAEERDTELRKIEKMLEE